MELLPYYLTESSLAVNLNRWPRPKGGESITLYFRTRAKVVGDLLVVEPVVCIFGEDCPVHGECDVGTVNQYRERLKDCESPRCTLRLGVMEALGIDPDLVGWMDYGWRVSGSPSELLERLKKGHQCRVDNINHDEGADWAQNKLSLIRAGHHHVIHTLMPLVDGQLHHRSWAERRLDTVRRDRFVRYGVSLQCYDGIGRERDQVELRHVDAVFEALVDVRKIEVAS